jgi:Fe-S cluster assembly protein SufD
MILKELDFDKQVLDNSSFLELKKIGFPNKKNEDYRHISLRNMLEKKLLMAHKEDNELCNNLYKEFINDEFYSLVFIDQKPNLEYSNLPNEISFTSSNKTNDRDMKALSLLSESFYDKDDILFIDKKLDKPLMIINVFNGVDKFFANSLHIKIQNDVVVDILEIFVSTKGSSNVYSINRDFFIENAKLNYTKLNISSHEDIININNTISVHKGEMIINTIEKGSKQSINNYDVALNEEFSSINMYGIVKISNNQNIANTIKVNHNAKNTSSNQIFKQILDDTSRAVFNSQITINKHCSFSKAHQNSQSILLNDEARMFNEPRMLILTDELEASHGATVGSFNEEAINYMKLRGLSQEKCEKILIEAFLTEIYDYIENDIIKNYL